MDAKCKKEGEKVAEERNKAPRFVPFARSEKRRGMLMLGHVFPTGKQIS